MCRPSFRTRELTVSEIRQAGKSLYSSSSLLLLQVREKAFREMKKDVGMTTAQKSKETRRMESLFCISSQQSLHIRRVASDYSVVANVRTCRDCWLDIQNKDSILLVSLLFCAVVIPTSFFISRNAFSLTCSWSFFPLFYGFSYV